MPEVLWLFIGLAAGVAITGFTALGSFERGADSVRKAPWRSELMARHTVTARRGLALGAARQQTVYAAAAQQTVYAAVPQQTVIAAAPQQTVYAAAAPQQLEQQPAIAV